MKTCSSCGTTKPLSGFYKDKQSKDGLKKRCKKCLNLYMRVWRHNNIEKSRASCRKWAGKPASKLSNIKRQREYTSNPENRCKLSARAYVRNRVNRGIIVKPKACSICGEEVCVRNLHAHHPNHRKPDVFIWACPCCHSLIEHQQHDSHQKTSYPYSEGCNTPGISAYS